jgi:hypothetical protein
MADDQPAAEEVFARVTAVLGDAPGVERPDPPGIGDRGFGASALRVNGRIFAMVSHGRLVFKLPARRVAELIGTGRGAAFDAGKGRPMKDWVTLESGRAEEAIGLATEALAFVRTVG